ncbi:MAG TPA: hypothetical protein VGH22_15045, partial [Candidatus Binatia bacterium]
PIAAWGLMGMIALFANALVGFGASDAKRESKLLLILPLVVAIAFFLIAGRKPTRWRNPGVSAKSSKPRGIAARARFRKTSMSKRKRDKADVK